MGINKKNEATPVAIEGVEGFQALLDLATLISRACGGPVPSQGAVAKAHAQFKQLAVTGMSQTEVLFCCVNRCLAAEKVEIRHLSRLLRLGRCKACDRPFSHGVEMRPSWAPCPLPEIVQPEGSGPVGHSTNFQAEVFKTL